MNEDRLRGHLDLDHGWEEAAHDPRLDPESAHRSDHEHGAALHVHEEDR